MRRLPPEEGVDAALQRVRDGGELLGVWVAVRIFPGLDGGTGNAHAAPKLGLAEALGFAELRYRFRGCTSFLTINYCRDTLTVLTVMCSNGALAVNVVLS